MTTRVAFIGAGHYHYWLYSNAVLALDDMSVVGVSDRDAGLAARRGEELDCLSSSSYEAIVDKTRPDFVFVLGRHTDMAKTGEFLVHSGIPFAMEKPCGMNFREVHRLAAIAEEHDVFAAVPLIWRLSDLVGLIRDEIGVENLRYLLFRRLLTTPSFFRDVECEWMLDPAQAGGGVLSNMGLHWVDLFLYLMGDCEVEVVSSFMSNDLTGIAVEDYASIVLRAGDATCVTDSGYVNPGSGAEMTVNVSARDVLLNVGGSGFGSIAREGQPTRRVYVSTAPDYPRFVADVLDQAARDESPIASLRDAARLMQVLDQAYRLAGRPKPADGGVTPEPLRL